MTALARNEVGVRRRAWNGLRIDAGWLACAAALAFAVLLRGLIDTNENVSWLIEAAEKVVGGARMYVDFLEVNPPASILIYIPGVLLGHWTGASSEQATAGLVFAGALASLAASADILRKSGSLPNHPRLVLVGALLVLLAVPTYTFAEREHVAVLAILPMLAAFAVRCTGRRVDGWSILMAGTGAAVAVSLKPIFALGLIGPAICLVAAQGWRRLIGSGELWLGAGFAGAYGAAVLYCLPIFAARVLPIALGVYVPTRVPVWLMLTEPGTLVWAGAAAVAIWSAQRQGFAPLVSVPLTASAGFAAAYVLQGKGFAYQCYPAIALSLVAVLLAAVQTPVRRPPPGGLDTSVFRRLQATSLVAIALGGAIFLDRHYDPEYWTPGLRKAVLAVAPRPTVLTISPNLAMGQPFTRSIGGIWEGSAPSTWITGDADVLIADGAAPATFESWIHLEQEIYARDIESRRPDVVLVDGARWQRWIDGSPLLSRAMQAYDPQGQFGAVTMWARRPGAQTPSESRP